MTREEYKDAALEVIENGNFDIVDEFTTEELAEYVSDVALKLEKRDVIDNHLGRYQVRIRNHRSDSFISVTDDDNTMVSRSLYYINDRDRMDSEEVSQTIMDMLNEAWFALRV